MVYAENGDKNDLNTPLYSIAYATKQYCLLEARRLQHRGQSGKRCRIEMHEHPVRAVLRLNIFLSRDTTNREDGAFTNTAGKRSSKCGIGSEATRLGL